MDDRIWQLAIKYLPNFLEPGPNRFHKRHKRKSASMKNRIKSGSQKIIVFKKDMIRNEFLYNCMILTEDEPIEYLIIGYGYASDYTTYIERAQIIRGSSHSVGIPFKVNEWIKDWIDEDELNEVILFHNHPEYWMNLLFSGPLPSGTDRDTLASYTLTPSYIYRRFLQGGGEIMFFVGQNGEVRQFYFPRLEVITKFLKEYGLYPSGIE